MTRSCLLLLLALLIGPSSAHAQAPAPGLTAAPALRSSTEKLFVSAQLNGAALNVDGDDDNVSGGGLNLKVGYGFTPLITGYVGLSGSAMDDEDADEVALGVFELGAQFNFRSGAHALVPYADVALSSQAYGNDDIMFSGGALSLGGGVKYFFSPQLSLDSGLSHSFGNFSKMEIDGDSDDIDEIGTRTTRLSVGISWYPLR